MILQIFLAFSSLFVLFILYFEGKRKFLKLPPGPVVWPVLGNMIEIFLADAKFAHLAFARLAEKYGPLMGLGFGAHYTVVISNFELMKDICSKPETGERYQFPYVSLRGKGNVNLGIIWNIGEPWQEIRRFTVRTLRDLGWARKGRMEKLIQDEASDFLEEIEKQAEANNNVFQVDNVHLSTNTVNVIWGLIAGFRFPPGDASVRETIKLSGDVMHTIGYDNKYTPFPFLKTLCPEWSGAKKDEELFTRVVKFTTEIVERIKENRRDEFAEPENFVESYLLEMEKRKDNVFTEIQLATVLFDLFVAGLETTSTTMMWMLMFIAQNPKVQENIFEEIMKVSGGTGVVKLSDDTRMPYTKATLYEVNRFAIVFPATGQRNPTIDIKVGDYVIPKDCLLLFNLYPVVMDKKYWGDPEVFRPERFFESNGEGEIKLNSAHIERVAVFGFGRRMCIGDTTAMMTLFVFLTTLVQSYRFSIIPGKEPCVIPKPGNLTNIPYNFSVKVEKRV